MNSRSLSVLLLASAAGLLNQSVEAQTTQTVQASPRWYVGGNVGRSDFGDCPGFASCDTRDTGYRLYGGYQPHPNVAFELGYANFGETTASVGGLGANIKASGWTGHVVGSLPVWNRFSILGRVGGIYGESKVGGAFGSRKDRGTQLAYGAGVRYSITSQFDVSAEWDRYRFDTVGGDSDVDLISIGVRMKF